MLYKYFRVSDNSFNGLRTHQLYCNHYEYFNDPFECWGIELREFPDPNKERGRFVAAAAAWGFTEDRLAEALLHYEDYVFSLEGTQPLMESALATARITCFASDARNLLMWAHYGDGLRGFCVAFDEAKLAKNETYRPHVFDVHYSEAPPIIDTALYAIAMDQYEWNTFKERRPEEAAIAEKLMAEIYQKLLASKPVQWKYEQEKRLIIEAPETATKTGLAYGYEPAAITGIVVGERMHDLHRQQLIEIVGALGVSIPVHTARRSRTTYEVLLD